MKMVSCLLILFLPWVVGGDSIISSDVQDFDLSSFDDGFPKKGCEASLMSGSLALYCTLPSGKVTLTVNKAATMLTLAYEQGSGPFSCEDLQQTKPAIQNYTNTRDTIARMKSLTIRDVVLSNESLACALALLGTDRTETLTLMGPTGDLSPSHLDGINGVKYLFMRDIDENTTRVPYAALARLPALRRAALSGGAFVLREERVALPELTVLELSGGKLKAIPKRAFVNTPALQMLLLFSNEIEYVDVDAFEGLAQLRNLSVSANRLAVLPAGALRHAPRLQRLDLYANRLRELGAPHFRALASLAVVVLFNNHVPLTLHNGTFANLPSLTELNLVGNSLTTLPEDLVANSTNLKTLNLQNNQLSSLPARLVAGLRLRHLDVSSNHLSLLREQQFADQDQLETLHLQNNRLEALPAAVFQDTTNLKVLDLSYNNISVLEKNLFDKLSHLQVLNLDGNRISDLQEVFNGLVALEELSLSHNNIIISEQHNTHLEWELGGPYPPRAQDAPDAPDTRGASPPPGARRASALGAPQRLQRLRLAHNRVELVCADWHRLFYLKELDLSYNNISTVSATDLNFQNSAKVILSHNNIHTADLPAYYGTQALPGLALPTIILSHNPFQCSCSMYPFLVIYKSRTNVNEDLVNIENAECASPPSLKGVKLTNVQLDSLTCDYPCPSGCDSCLARPDKSQVELTCSEVPRNWTAHDLPDSSLSYSLKLSNVSDSNSLALDLPPIVRFVDLSNLNLTAPPVATSVTVDLRNNSLSTVPVGLIESNCSLYLGNNPIQCVCENLMDLKTFVKHNRSILDFQTVQCAGENRLVKDVDLVYLCYDRNMTIILAVMFIVLILVLVACLMIYKKWSYIRFLLHKLGVWPYSRNELCSKDIFVSYAHQEEHYVLSHVIPQLEKSPAPLTLCVASRDWRLGDTIAEQIQRSIDTSSLVIVLLSPSYLNSSWCRMEFRLAHKQGKIGVVKMDDFDEKHKELMPEMKAYLKTNTYLKQSDPLLYEKIREAVEKAQSKQKRAREKMLNSGGIDTQLDKNGMMYNNALTAPPA